VSQLGLLLLSASLVLEQAYYTTGILPMMDLRGRDARGTYAGWQA